MRWSGFKEGTFAPKLKLIGATRIMARYAIILAFCLSACGGVDDEAYDRGYGDGYAVGYNTTCEIRATIVDGNWSDEDYSRGYADGQTDGTIACNADRKDGTAS